MLRTIVSGLYSDKWIVSDKLGWSYFYIYPFLRVFKRKF